MSDQDYEIANRIEMAYVYTTLATDAAFSVILVSVIAYLVYSTKGCFWRDMPRLILVSLTLLVLVYICWVWRDIGQVKNDLTYYETYL